MDIFGELEQHIDRDLVSDLETHYRVMKTAHLQRDWEKTSLNGGKFVESITRVLQHVTSGDGSFESGDIRVDRELRQIIALPRGSCSESLRLRIPRVALAVYDVRNNRNVAHSSREIDPNQMDSLFVVSACDWILAELVRLYLTSDIVEANRMIQRITERQVPFAEQIDGDVVVLDPDLTYKDQLLATLYIRYPERTTNSNLREWTRPRHNSYVPQYLSILEDERLVHRNEKGSKLTLRGLRYVETEIAQVT